MIVDALLAEVGPKVGDKRLADVRIGLGYTGVLVDNGSCGLAYTFRNELGKCCGVLKYAGKMKGLACSEVIGWAAEKNLAMAAVGLATINALLQGKAEEYQSGNIFEKIKLTGEETLGVIGDFAPVRTLSQKAKTTYIFERNIEVAPPYYPSQSIPQYLPQCDVVVITATSLVNKTFDEIIANISKAKEIVVVGPSTPLAPQVFKGYGVTLLGGILVQDAQQVLGIVSQGGGTPSLGTAVQQVYLTL